MKMKVVAIKSIADVSSGNTPSRRKSEYWNGSIPWITTGELESGYVTASKECVTEKALKETALKLYHKGTVLIAMYGQGKTRGTAAVLGIEATVNQACAALTVHSGCSKFLFYQLQNSYHAIRRLSNTGNQENLNAEIIKNFKILWPDELEQQKIAAILSTQDKVIELKEKLLEEKQRQKRCLMQQLITGKKRLPGFSGNWSTDELEEVFDYIQPTPYLVKSTNYSNSYLTPVLTAGKTFVLGYTDEVEGIYHDLPVVIFDDFTTDSKYVDFPFKAKSSAMKILKIKDGYNIGFAYEAMQMLNFAVGGHERHWISRYSKLTIDAPCLEEQAAIANVISIIDKELALLQQDLEQEKQKKKALMQLLLTGIVRV